MAVSVTGTPTPACKLARLPKSRLDFWKPKLDGNRERDLRNQDALTALGWDFMVVWECEIREKERVENKIIDFVRRPGA